MRHLAPTSSASSTRGVSDLVRLNTSHPSSTSQSRFSSQPRILSCYLSGRRASEVEMNTYVLQGSKLSHSLFSFYIADMPGPNEPVKRVCYADVLTVWATLVKIQDLGYSLNSYLEEIIAYLKNNSFLISAPKFQSRFHHGPSQALQENMHLELTTTAGPMPKCIRSLSRRLYHSTIMSTT